MYRELDLLMYRYKVAKAALAAEIGVTINTFRLKLAGKYRFTLDEALTIVSYFNKTFDLNLTVETVFCTDSKTA